MSAAGTRNAGPGSPRGNQERERGAEERRRAEQRAGSRGAEVAERPHEEPEAEPVARESEQHDLARERAVRDGHSQRQRENEREQPGRESLDGDDRHRVLRRHLSGEVVVESPQDARGHDAESADGNTPGILRLPRQEQACRNDERDRHPDATAHRLAKEQRGEEHGRDGLEVAAAGKRLRMAWSAARPARRSAPRRRPTEPHRPATAGRHARVPRDAHARRSALAGAGPGARRLLRPRSRGTGAPPSAPGRSRRRAASRRVRRRRRERRRGAPGQQVSPAARIRG